MALAESVTGPALQGRGHDMLAALDSEQRAAALLPDGPALVIAPAGSGKTTTLVTRIGVLLGRGVPADRIAVVTFNRAAAVELSTRLRTHLDALAEVERVEVRTLHALALRILGDAGESVRLVADRLPMLRAAHRAARHEAAEDEPPPDLQVVEAELSAWKIEGRPPSAGAWRVIDRYQQRLGERRARDFDDLVSGAVARLEDDAALSGRWQGRFSHVCVDEFQDVDAAQVRLIALLAHPEQNLWVVGDDDQP